MTDFPVQLVFDGPPFDSTAVRHTLRHLAMRVGWRLVPESSHRLIYSTRESQGDAVDSTTLAIVSSPAVADHLRSAYTPFPLMHDDRGWLPFPHRAAAPRPGLVPADVVAGAHACLNLWYEQRTRPATQDGWITYEQDWMARTGMPAPLPLADQWLDRIYEASLQLGWPATQPHRQFTVILTHDVDYLPGLRDRGLPRLARAVYRQVMLRRRPLDALRLGPRYLAALARGEPYRAIPGIVAEERRRGARSSFQFVVAHEHPADPGYAAASFPLDPPPPEWEICLHGSYLACRRDGQLVAERTRLETLTGTPALGHRQHYLNFEPGRLFREVAGAGFGYDMSVGYNDHSGPRAGTYFPYRPYDLDAQRPHAFWEIPFVLMDTTLATTCCYAPDDALENAQAALQPVIDVGGCVSIIWHQEQCGGLLDPGYDRVYGELLDWLASHGGRLTNGGALLAELDSAWEASASE